MIYTQKQCGQNIEISQRFSYFVKLIFLSIGMKLLGSIFYVHFINVLKYKFIWNNNCYLLLGMETLYNII
uniref:7TM_GPCR_Srx domain-containing protein n=1 Tax=Heterorhabditis bacteriophora TaxID=37862 RepID=A0A1I7WV44_HETBA